MGGNLLKKVGVERKSAEEYRKIVGIVISNLKEIFPSIKMAEIKAYEEKDSFGDADILVEYDDLPGNWIDIIKLKLNPTEFISNRSNGGRKASQEVHSFDFMNLQIDLIMAPKDLFDFSMNYLSFNDLGNLMGVIAHNMGLKYGSSGLMAPLRAQGDGHQYAEVAVTKSSEEAIRFLGYDFDRFRKGFRNLEEIFEFVISSEFIERKIYLLENRNNKSRTRDKKRTTYTQFLQWIGNRPDADKFRWPKENDEDGKVEIKKMFLEKVKNSFPDFKKRLEGEAQEMAMSASVKLKWNGVLVKKWTDANDIDLYQIMLKAFEKNEFKKWVVGAAELELIEYAKNVFSLIEQSKKLENKIKF